MKYLVIFSSNNQAVYDDEDAVTTAMTSYLNSYPERAPLTVYELGSEFTVEESGLVWTPVV